MGQITPMNFSGNSASKLTYDSQTGALANILCSEAEHAGMVIITHLKFH
jgi:hypothetical protein